MMSFVMSSENRKKIVKTLFLYSKRQWSCSVLEEITKISHATVFRTLSGLTYYGLLKTTKINRKDIIYELVLESPFTKELRRILELQVNVAKTIAKSFADKIKLNGVLSVMLYGSTAKGDIKPESDIDVLVIISNHDKELEKEIYDDAGELSSKYNKTISPVIMTEKDLRKEKNSNFIKSVKANMEVLYGKNPFGTSKALAGRS